MDLNEYFFQRLEGYRQKLLNLNLRNSLLNFKHHKKRRNFLRIIHTTPDLFLNNITQNSLVVEPLPELDDVPDDEKTPEFTGAYERAKLTDEQYLNDLKNLEDKADAFEATDFEQRLHEIERSLLERVRINLELPPRRYAAFPTENEWAKRHGINPAYDLPLENDTLVAEAGSKSLQAKLYREDLNRTLNHLRTLARQSEQEMGINTLFAAVGFLEWFESEDSEKVIHSPLLLHPVRIERIKKKGNEQFTLSSLDEPTETNYSLVKRLENHGITLPVFNEEEHEGFEAYLKQVASVITTKKRWRVKRFITIAPFQFAQLVLYRDLDPERNPQLAEHNVLRDLLIGQESQGLEYAQTYDVDEDSVAEQLRFLPFEADSSQLSAIKDVLDGKNLVIKGPPGTGKSQTITNLIAALLAKGKSVLFVAEKLAALQVVKNKLDSESLDAFCLALHSTKDARKEVYQSFKERIELQPHSFNSSELEQVRAELKRVKEQLNTYARTMGSEYALNKTVYMILWTYQVLKAERDLPTELKNVEAPELKTLNEVDAGRIETKMRSYTHYQNLISKHYASIEQHPWYGLASASLNHFDQQRLAQLITEHHTRVSDLLSSLNASQFIPELTSLKHIGDYLSTRVSLSSLPENMNASLLHALGSEEVREQAQAFINDKQLYEKHYTRLTQLSDHPEACISTPDETTKSLLSEAARLNTADLEVRSVPAQQQAIKDAQTQAEKASHSVSQILELLSFTDEISTNDVTSITTAQKILRKVPKELLIHRNAAFENHANELHLESLDKEKDALMKYFRSQNPQLDTVLPLDPKSVREAAQVLSNAGGLGFLSTKVRQANKLHNSIYPNVKNDNNAKASVLNKLATALNKAKALSKDEVLMELAGTEFKGFNTNVKQLMNVTKYYGVVRKHFPLTSAFNRTIKTFLLSANIDELDAFQDLARNLEDFSSTLSVTGINPELSLADSVSALKSRQDFLSHFQAFSAQLEIKEHVSVDSLTELRTSSEAIRNLQNNLAKHQKLQALLGEELSYQAQSNTIEEHLGIALEYQSTSGVTWDLLKHDNWRALSEQLDEQVKQLDQNHKKCIASWANITSFTTVDETAFLPGQHALVTLSELQAKLNYTLNKQAHLAELVDFQRSVQVIKEEPELNRVLNEGVDLNLLAEHFKHYLYYNVVHEVIKDHPVLANFEGFYHEQLRQRFSELERETVRLEREELVSTLASKPVESGNARGNVSDLTELAAIQHQTTLSKPRLSIRQVLESAPLAAQQLKPCFLMSPLSVGKYLSAEAFKFDVVIIDEASQMLPEDAFSAIIRGKQLVVVGDPEQLPPTSFFTAQLEEDEEEEAPSESILELASTRFRPMRELLFHYRSKHQELIAFSNKEFYDDRLTVFPSPLQTSDSVGVTIVFVQDGLYKTGTGLNIPEANTLINEAKVFMERYPKRSMGIATVNKKQAEYLSHQFDSLYNTDPVVQAYFDWWQDDLESFFVKNLENVQGDERDSIFISTVYGPNEKGHVYQRFGPINSVTGYRRLNVLFTRAKYHVRLFTSMKPADIVPSETSHRGVHVLRNYLTYAATGQLHVGEATGLEPDSDFERFVLTGLKNAGWQATCQVGVAGFRIDMAVQHPNDPSLYILGVECDGATYHSSRSARDRDKIRQQILEGLGWKIYRIWSTDWFANPERELKKLTEHLTRSLNLEKPSQDNKTIEEKISSDQSALEDGVIDFSFIEEVEPEPPEANDQYYDQFAQEITGVLTKADRPLTADVIAERLKRDLMKVNYCLYKILLPANRVDTSYAGGKRYWALILPSTNDLSYDQLSQKILEVLAEADHLLTANEIANRLKRNPGNVNECLQKILLPARQVVTSYVDGERYWAINRES